MSVVGVRVGHCVLCGWPCDRSPVHGDLCPAHSDCGEPGDDQWKSLRIADSLSTGGQVDRVLYGGYGSPMDAAEQREAVRDYTFPPGTSPEAALASLPPLPAGTLIEVWQSDDAIGVQTRQPTRERVA